MDLTALKAELDNDPMAVGYSSMSDVDVAESLSKPDREADITHLESGILAACLDPDDVQAASGSDRAYLQMVISAGAIPLTSNLKKSLKDVLGSESATTRNLKQYMKRKASRSDELGLGHVTPSDVANARRL